MLRIYLTRHGQNQDNVDGILNGRRDKPLTKLGMEQAGLAAQFIEESGLVFNDIYTSPLIRASKTAEIIAGKLGMSAPKILPELIERDFGVMTGKPVSDITALCSPDIIEAGTTTYFLSPEGAETFPTLIERATKVLNYVTENNSDGSVLLVTHGDIGKMIYAAYYKLDWYDVLLHFHFGNSEIILMSEDSSADSVHIFKQRREVSN